MCVGIEIPAEHSKSKAPFQRAFDHTRNRSAIQFLDQTSTNEMRPKRRSATTQSSVGGGERIGVSRTDPGTIPSVPTRHPSIHNENGGECSRENTSWGSGVGS